MEKRIALKMNYNISKPTQLSKDIRKIISKNGNQLKTEKNNLKEISTFTMTNSFPVSTLDRFNPSTNEREYLTSCEMKHFYKIAEVKLK